MAHLRRAADAQAELTGVARLLLCAAVERTHPKAVAAWMPNSWNMSLNRCCSKKSTVWPFQVYQSMCSFWFSKLVSHMFHLRSLLRSPSACAPPARLWHLK